MRHLLHPASRLSYMQGDPLASFRKWVDEPQNSGAEALLLVDFELQRYWLDAAEPQALAALYCVFEGQLRVAVTDISLICEGSAPATQFDNWVAQHRLVAFTPGTTLELLPLTIAKPWGREIWYSAIEQRGVCDVGLHGRRVPLPWLQAVLPDICAETPGEPLVLLKVLDPLPQPVTGDLYWEVHETKREVYVVTHIDPQAWPDGVGYIRYGFSAKKLSGFVDEQSFRAQYLVAVRAYEKVRRQLDAQPADAVSDGALLELEQNLRAEMDGFTHMRQLRVGDVVVVPPGLPHALQHGVRTVEFQTPVYERRILSFAQQVLTQTHWDTQEALEMASLSAPPELPFACLVQEDGVRVERIVDYPDFEVRRIYLDAGASFTPEPIERYGLLLVVTGELLLCGSLYRAEQGILLPRAWQGALAPSGPLQPLVLLLALPRSSVVEPGRPLWQNLRPCETPPP